jgi:homoserine kinase
MTLHRAPATSANLGPGFDCVAVALDLWNELEVSDGEGVEIEGEGAGELPADESNLVVRAYALFASPRGKRFRMVNRIPLERGLGSSAAAIALGLAAATNGHERTLEELLEAGAALEGHSDNLAAALAGGVCATWEGRVVRLAEGVPLVPIALVPDRRISTEGSRNSLPKTVPHEAAAYTAARATLLGAGLATGALDLLAAAFDDRLHEPYRAASAPELEAVRTDPPTGAVGASLSGSGPTVIVWAREDTAGETTAELAQRYPEHRVLPLAVTPKGAG